MAAHLADVLLSGQRGFVKEPNGQWTLSTSEPEAIESPPRRAAAPRARTARTAETVVACVVERGDSRPISTLSFAVVDVETTGSRAGWGDRITEFAAVWVDSGQVTESFDCLVNPERPIPPEVTRLTRITSDMVRRAPRFQAIAQDVAGKLEGRIFVAHNASFDWRFVSTEFLRATGERLVGERLCTVRLSRALLPMLRRRSLDAVARYFDVEITERHRAGGDALATAKVLIRLLHMAEDQGVATLDDLRQLGRSGKKSRRKRRALPHWMTRDDSA
ncbi:MAG: exonuclease domain-containing protein [Gemmatimonadaceae bacterium]